MGELCWRCVLERWPHADGIASQVSTGGIQCFKNQLFIPGIKGYASNTCVLMTMRWNSSLSCCSFSNCVFKAAVIFWSCFHNRNGINTVNHNANGTPGTDKLQVIFFIWNIQTNNLNSSFEQEGDYAMESVHGVKWPCFPELATHAPCQKADQSTFPPCFQAVIYQTWACVK